MQNQAIISHGLQRSRPKRARRVRVTPTKKETANQRSIELEPVPQVVRDVRSEQSTIDHNAAVTGKSLLGGRRRSVRGKRAKLNPPMNINNVRKDVALFSDNTKTDVSRNRFESLLQSQVLPEKYPPLQWPDNSLGRSSPFKTIINSDLQLLKKSYGPNFLAGSNKVIQMPSFANPIWFLDEHVPGTIESYRVIAAHETPYVGLREVSNHLDGESELNGSMVITQEYKNFLGIFTDAESDPVAAILPFKNNDQDDNAVFFGYSWNTTGGGTSIHIATDYGLATITNGLQIQLVRANAPNIVITGDLVAGVSTITLVGGNNNGDNMIGYRIRLNPGVTNVEDVVASTIRIEVEVAANAPQLIWKALQFPDQNAASEIYQKYRVTAMSLLLTYTGPTINNGGQITSILQTGKPALYDGTNSTGFMWMYGGISSAPRSYNGQVIKGTYVWWYPDDPLVMSYRPLNTSIDQIFTFPHIIASVNYTPTPNVDPVAIIRLRTIIDYECVTSYSFIPSFPTPVSKPNLKMYIKRLVEATEVPNAMENDWHDAILRQLSNVNELVTKGAPLVGGIIQNVAPLMAMLGFL